MTLVKLSKTKWELPIELIVAVPAQNKESS